MTPCSPRSSPDVSSGLAWTSRSPIDHPLLQRDDVVVTPHVASATADGKLRIFRAAFEQVVDGLAGRRPAYLVNPEVWAATTGKRG